MINEEQKARGQEGKRVTSLNTLAPCGRGQGEGSKSIHKTLSRICKFAFCSLTNSTLSQRERISSKAAFTLAEVLITLGIIGVVAAMTLPALIQNHRNHVAETRLKKFYSAINQAITASEAVNGDRTEWHNASGYNIPESGRNEQAKVWFDTYLKPYMNVIDEGYSSDNRFIVYFSDGSAMKFHHYDSLRDYLFYIGNPDKCDRMTEQYGTCKFAFTYVPQWVNDPSRNIFYVSRNFEPYKFEWDGSENSLYTKNYYGCSGQNKLGYYCTALIQYNNWKIPKDYPRKILY
ncbi:type II secretion system protein [bacterium]|nr:type II secretion system protein [bacterium]